jgi:hypothetical protein
MTAYCWTNVAEVVTATAICALARWLVFAFLGDPGKKKRA